MLPELRILVFTCHSVEGEGTDVDIVTIEVFSLAEEIVHVVIKLVDVHLTTSQLLHLFVDLVIDEG